MFILQKSDYSHRLIIKISSLQIRSSLLVNRIQFFTQKRIRKILGYLEKEVNVKPFVFNRISVVLFEFFTNLIYLKINLNWQKRKGVHFSYREGGFILTTYPNHLCCYFSIFSIFCNTILIFRLLIIFSLLVLSSNPFNQLKSFSCSCFFQMTR